MSKYFENFPITKYSFGDNEEPVYFEKLTTYIDLFESIKEVLAFYTTVEVIDGERPDTLSYRLYGTTDYHWTFYFMNEKIRESGWPLTVDREYELIREYYPNWVITTESPIAQFFPAGQVITHNTGITSTVVKKYPDLGQLVISPASAPNQSNLLLSTTQVTYLEGGVGGILRQAEDIVSVKREYEAVHHYENLSGEYVDINPDEQGFEGGTDSTSGLTTITWEERFKSKNEDLRQLTVLRSDVVAQVVGQFNRALKK